MGKIIKVDGLKFKYEQDYIIDNLNLEIESNTFISIVGPNGSGKTTLIKLLLGMYSYEGYIAVNNTFLYDQTISIVRRNFGVVFDKIDDNLIMETVVDNLIFSLENLNYSTNEIDDELKQIINLFDLYNILNRDPYNLNNSDKQKVAIASILITKPNIIILDDCINQLSVKDKNNLFEILRKYKKKYKTTIILITHDLEDTLNTDRVIILNKGKVFLDNTPFRVFKDYEKIKKLDLKLPFMVDLSLKLMEQNIIDHIYLDQKKLGDDLWK